MKDITITITTDYPNADGIAHVAAKALFKRFTRKPRFNTSVNMRSISRKRDGGHISDGWTQVGE